MIQRFGNTVLATTALCMVGLAGAAWAQDSASQIPTSGEMVEGAPFMVERDWGPFKLADRIAAKVKAGEPINYVFSYQASGIPLFSPQYAAGFEAGCKMGNEIYPMDCSSIAPVQTDANAAVTFLESQISGSTYLSLDDENRYILAFRARLAQVAGEPTGTLPANHRLYAGGAGSIRGFEFQKAGPLDANNDPLGGRSLVTFGAEFRWRITDTIGIVPFIDGGNVYDSTVPNTSEKLFWGAGLGFRYYTDFGPLRADFAVPLNPRKNIDDPYQFYISLGQAF